MNLTLKSVFILKYLSDINGLSDNLKTVMKTDDDCYVNIQALAHLTKMGNMGKTFLGKLWVEFDVQYCFTRKRKKNVACELCNRMGHINLPYTLVP